MYLGLKLKYGMLTIKVKTSKEFSFFDEKQNMEPSDDNLRGNQD